MVIKQQVKLELNSRLKKELMDTLLQKKLEKTEEKDKINYSGWNRGYVKTKSKLRQEFTGQPLKILGNFNMFVRSQHLAIDRMLMEKDIFKHNSEINHSGWDKRYVRRHIK